MIHLIYINVHAASNEVPVEIITLDTHQIIEALEGDSNDAEHDALAAVADALDLHYEASPDAPKEAYGG